MEVLSRLEPGDFSGIELNIGVARLALSVRSMRKNDDEIDVTAL